MKVRHSGEVRHFYTLMSVRHSKARHSKQQAEDKKKAAEALQDRLLAKQKAMMDARANDQGVMQMYVDNMQSFNPMLHGHW